MHSMHCNITHALQLFMKKVLEGEWEKRVPNTHKVLSVSNTSNSVMKVRINIETKSKNNWNGLFKISQSSKWNN